MTAATDPQSSDQMQAMLAQVGRSWGLVLAFAILSLILGLAAIFWPGATIVTVAILFALQLFIAGIFGIVRAFSADADTGARVLSLIIGILGVIVGFALLRSPFQSVVVMAFVIGIYWVAHGIMELVGAFSHNEGRVWGRRRGHLDRGRVHHPRVPDHVAGDTRARGRDLAGDPRESWRSSRRSSSGAWPAGPPAADPPHQPPPSPTRCRTERHASRAPPR